MILIRPREGPDLIFLGPDLIFLGPGLIFLARAPGFPALGPGLALGPGFLDSVPSSPGRPGS